MTKKRSRCSLLLALALVCGSGWWMAAAAWAGSALLRNSAVGGVSISVDGVLSDLAAETVEKTRTSWEEALQGAPTKMEGAVPMRKVSLRGLEAALADAVRNRGGAIPEDVMFLGGIQRIEYVLVYPEQNDIVLAGPGEGWKVDERGNVVGVTTGLPVLTLDDLLVAFRSVQAAREGAVNCSINPTPEGVLAIQRLLKQINNRLAPDIGGAIEEAIGPQVISISGVPETSHFARVMVAADYRMKRIAMQLDASPVAELPSYLRMLQESRARISGTAQPRWWLACNYQPLARSEDGLAWKLRGPGVKVVTEENVMSEDGDLKAARGRSNPLAQKWADRMTDVYDELAHREPIFAQLRNIMDLSVVAALMEKEGLREKAKLGELPNLMNDVPTESYHAPKSLSTKCTIVRRGNDFIFMASGGVQVDSWDATAESEVDGQLKAVRHKSLGNGSAADWWWN